MITCIKCKTQYEPKKILAACIYNDPPYNIGMNYATGIGTENKYQGNYENDKKKDDEYGDFLEASIKNAIKHAAQEFHIFYWCDEKYIWLLQNLFKKNNIDSKRVCLWIKNNQNPTPQIAFNKAYEACVYGAVGRPFLNPNYRAFNEVMNREIGTGNQMADDIIDLLNIWIIKRDAAQEYEHPTQKPIPLHEKPLKRCTGPGAIVVDLFGGSGSTLMACEQLNRKAYIMEIDPIFVQVVINRYEEYTGNKAKKIN